MAYPRVQERPATVVRATPIGYQAALAGMLVLSVLLRMVGVGRYPGLIYDEYYYVPAADVLLGRKPPVLVKHAVAGIDPNLLSHPPLAKELIALAIWTLGNHPWVWRLPGVVFGSLVPLIVAGIAYQLFQRRSAALLAALLASADGLLLTMSRVALPDSTAVPLVLLALWALVAITRKLRSGEEVGWLSWIGMGVLFGLGLAAEWIGGQAILLAWVWLLASGRSVRNTLRRWVPATTIVPFLVYYATYFYAWPSGYHQSWLPHNPFIAFFKLQWLMLKAMWKLRFFHPWTSNAWTWLGIPRPTALLLSVSNNQAIRLMAFSDPVIVWFGLAAMVAGLWFFRRHRAVWLSWGFLMLWLLAFYGTWLTTPRSKFLYYFTTASVGLDIAAAVGWVFLWEAAARSPWRRVGKVLGVASASVGMLSMLYLLPLWVGMATPRPFYHSVWWPSSWNPRVKAASVSQTQSFPLTYHPTSQHVQAWTGLSRPTGLAALPTPWTMFRGAPTHNSAYRAAWTLQRGYALHLGTAVAEAPTVAGSTFYVGTNSDQLYAVNVLTGQVEWSVGVPNMAMTAPLVDNNLVVIGIGNNGFRAYEPRQGWIRGQGANGVMAFNAENGHEAWYYATTGEDMATPVIHGQVVYEVTGGGRLIALNLETGALLWQKRIGGFDSMSSLMMVGHELYVATNLYLHAYPATRSTVWAINVDTQKVSWRTHVRVASGLSDCTVAVDAGRVFVAGVPAISNHGQGTRLSNKLFALSAATGKLLWSRSLGTGEIKVLDQEEEGIPLAVHGVVYIGSPVTHQLTAFSEARGRLLWTAHLPAPVTGNPVMVHRQLVVAAMNGRLYLVNAANGHVVGRDPASLGPIGPASPLIVSNALLQSTLNGDVVVQRIGG